MRIKTTGDLVQDDIQLISLMPQAAAELREKKTRTADGEEGELKLAPNGQVQYRTPFKCMALQDGVPSREERNVSVTVLNRLDIKPAQYYRLDGQVWMTPYSAGNQVGVSIIAENIVPVNAQLNFKGKE